MPLRHVVLLTLDDSCDVDGLVAALQALPGSIPALRSYVVGSDAGLAEGNATVAVVADVDDEAGWRAYVDHPAHQQVNAERVRPHLVARTAVQHWTSGGAAPGDARPT
jgi:hypothetical protein